MAKPELGLKRQCLHYGTRFYDLNKDPIVCPKCGEILEIAASLRAPIQSDNDDQDVAVGGPEIVSLDEVAAAENGVDPLKDDIDVDDDVDGDDTFLEEEEEGADDVSDLIDSDLKDDEET